MSFHGSGLWNLFSDDFDRLYNAWNVAVRHAWNLPKTTHRYLIESISGSLHPKVMLASRYSKFVKSLQSSPKYSVRVLASMCTSDLRTVMGHSLDKICNECDMAISSDSSYPTPAQIKKNMKYFPVPVNEKWRTGAITELLDKQFPGFTENEMNEIVSYLCKT